MKAMILNDFATIPTRGSEDAAGYDLYAAVAEPVTIPAHETVKIPTGLAFEIPKGYCGLIFARSGLATKEGLRPANCVGVIDADYRGEAVVALHNDTDTEKTVEPKSRVAQLVIIPFKEEHFELVSSLDKTARGTGGFGSTGK